MLVFSVGEHVYAMDILHLREVGRLPQLEPEPGAPPGVLGIARLHGQPVRVYDLAPVLGEASRPAAPGPPAGLPARPWLLVSRGERGDRYWQVDQVQDIVDYDPAQVQSGTEVEEAGRAAGILELDGRLTYLLTPDLLAHRQAP
jgi:chemotaxis signal transduction protein